MIKFFECIVIEILHYFNLIFGLFDFMNLAFTLIIIVLLVIVFFVNQDFRYGVSCLIGSTLGLIKTLTGFLFFALFIGYYIYIAMFFEEKITFIVLILSIYSFVKDFLKINLNLVPYSNNGFWDSIKDICISAVLLFIQQLSAMFEGNNFNNLKYVILSLAIIPTFVLMFLVMRHYCIFIDFYNKYKNYIKMNDYEFFKIFNDCLIECETYKETENTLSNLILNNNNTSCKKMKILLRHNIHRTKDTKKNFAKKYEKNIKYKRFGFFKIFNYIWIFNILAVVVSVIFNKYLDMPLNFWYFGCYGTLLIYFWCDLMKLKKIENKFDFIIYVFVYMFFIFFLLIYNYFLPNSRLTEFGFLIPIFITVRIFTYSKKFPNLMVLPFLSEKNFGGLDPRKYKKE